MELDELIKALIKIREASGNISCFIESDVELEPVQTPEVQYRGDLGQNACLF